MLRRMLAKKLMVRPGSRVAVIGAPPTIDLVLANGAVPSERGPADIVLLYTRDRAALAGALPKATKRLAEGGTLWVAYPKAGQLGTDLNRDSLARTLQAGGLEPVAQIAVDDVWSALRVKRDAALSATRKVRGTFAAKTAKKTAAKKKTAKVAKKKTAKVAKKKTATKKKSR
jgi:hypothetical protein